MADVIHWQSLTHHEAALRRLVAAVRAGRLVVLPTDSGYCCAASGLAEEAVESLREFAGLPLLAVRSAAEARDWAPQLGGATLRLLRRVWPGPLTLAVPNGQQGLSTRLPSSVRDYLHAAGPLSLRQHSHPLVRALLSRLPAPLLVAPLPAQEPGPTAEARPSLEDRVSLVIDAGPCPSAPEATVIQPAGEGWQILRPGAISEQELCHQSACLIVFVCTGNTCRSPLAEALCKKRLADRLGCSVNELPQRGFVVLSAGLSAMMGGEAAPEAVEVAHSYGADLADHHSRPLTAELASQADYLLVMTQGHLRSLQATFSRSGVAPRLLDPAGADIADPIGCEHAVYEECGRDIWRHLDALLDQLLPAAAPAASGQEQVKP
jgi:protein-tyrosine phosphatase